MFHADCAWEGSPCLRVRHWLVGHCKDLQPRPQAPLCSITAGETLFVSVRGSLKEKKKVWRQKRLQWEAELPRGKVSEGTRNKNFERLRGYLQTILLYVYVTKYTLLSCVWWTDNRKEGGKCGRKPREQHWVGFCRARNPAPGKHTPTTDSLIKTILLKKKKENFEKVGLCVCALIQTHTHTPLSLSHYQLAFHPVSHPSVQMVRKAASMLSLFLSPCYTHSFGGGKKINKRLCQRVAEAKQGRDTDWMSGGFNCKSSSQRPESWIWISCCSCSVSSQFLLNSNFLFKKRTNFQVPPISIIVRDDECQQADLPRVHSACLMWTQTVCFLENLLERQIKMCSVTVSRPIPAPLQAPVL